MRKRFLLALTALLAGLGPAQAEGRARWDTDVLARVQAPGFPANVYVHQNGRVYAGTFTNPGGDKISSIVREWTADGTLLRSWSVPGQDLTQPHGIQVTTSDSAGRLVLLDRTSGRILKLDIDTGTFSAYSVVKDLPTCLLVKPCSPNLVDEKPAPNYGAWGPDGSLYVSDYGQAVIWRVPPGGGAAEPWFTSNKLDGVQLGTAGLVLSPDHKALLVMQQTSLGRGEPNVATGKLYRIDLASKTITKLWESLPMDLPDGFSFSESGKVYIANAGSNQLVVLDQAFAEIERVPALPATGDNGSKIPFDTPSNMTFSGESVLIANQSFFGNRDNHAILDVYVGEAGLPVFIP